MVKNKAPPTNKKIIVGISVPGKLCNTTPPHQSAIGVNASLIRSSNPLSVVCAVRGKQKSDTKKVMRNFMVFIKDYKSKTDERLANKKSFILSQKASTKYNAKPTPNEKKLR